MIYLDKNEMDTKCKQLSEDVKNKKPTSGVWAWIGLGAITGFILSCVKFRRPEKKPIIATLKKEEENKWGR